ncbi:hypothetical protein [Achromobacter ruhlandii]|uniref:Uncharacterized protein n=1 Tax=Achromobacter ruhlandii TaxID=72557 RepID=A0ABM8M1U7_9BURK|nr:hypothetical protein [Achromobacter ruhlandii]AKP88989.1 hypothetical protein Axylo_1469 [Achromobacter xylosoxidans]MCZ8432228.1 hypothetical protein [Achromobacter ruhlandii]MDC6087011.1 hypothetical protein [Achromobacter ruhlandii]MDC6154252.1 hypothetical protein [Achromobacter ruhlandii]MDD7979579.1 hypothetical protein [Achromobacter ruhlandii]
MEAYGRLHETMLVEIIVPPDGVSIHDMFHPDFVELLVDLSPFSPLPSIGDLYENGVFVSPVIT